MSIWHPNIDVHEIHGTRVENWDASAGGSSVTVSLVVPAEYIDEFVNYYIDNRKRYVAGYDHFILFTKSISVRPDKARYDLLKGATGIVVPENFYIVDITFDATAGSLVNMFGQVVWVTEKISATTEKLGLDPEKLKWEDEKPFTAEQGPGKTYRSFRIDMTIERLNILAEVGQEERTVEGILIGLTDKCNANNNQFHTFHTIFLPEQITVTLDSMDFVAIFHNMTPPTVKYISTPTYAQEVKSTAWYTVRLTFHVRYGIGVTWNTFYRVKPGQQSGQDASGWEAVFHNKTGLSQVRIFEPSTDFNYILR